MVSTWSQHGLSQQVLRYMIHDPCLLFHAHAFQVVAPGFEDVVVSCRKLKNCVPRHDKNIVQDGIF